MGGCYWTLFCGAVWKWSVSALIDMCLPKRGAVLGGHCKEFGEFFRWFALVERFVGPVVEVVGNVVEVSLVVEF